MSRRSALCRTVALVHALVITFTLVPYVRRTYLAPSTTSVAPEPGGSRDRTLHGKARVRARKQERR